MTSILNHEFIKLPCAVFSIDLQDQFSPESIHQFQKWNMHTGTTHITSSLYLHFMHFL